MQKFFSQTVTELANNIQNLYSQPGFRRTAQFGFTSAGFTIVELLIVVVIIGVLAAIVVVAYNGVTESARASAFADGFRKIEKAFNLYNTENALSSWPQDDTFTGGGNPRINEVISNSSSFRNYLQSQPKVSGFSGDWRYDYDLDTYNGCSSNANGVNIYIGSFTDTNLAQKIDATMDDGNTACGKMRIDASGNLVYNLSRNGSL